MKAARLQEEVAIPSGRCVACGKPLDSKYFDHSQIVRVPEPGEQALLARFELPPQYCGVLEYFAQFTNAFAQDSSKVQTPGLFWQLLQNGKPLYPYTPLEHIVNPWGYGSFQVALRLTEGAVIEFVARRAGFSQTRDPLNGVTHIGGRIVGRYWYNPAYGGFEVGGGA